MAELGARGGRRILGGVLAVVVAVAAIVVFAGTASAAAGSVRFSLSSLTVSEGQGLVSIGVQRDGGTDAFSVDHVVTGGTAVSGTDFTGGNGTLGFANGENTRSFNVNILDDGIVGSSRTIVIRLQNAGAASIAAPIQITITILDNDVSTIEFQSVCYPVVKPILPANGTVNVVVERAGATGGTATVAYTITPVTAGPGDYTAAPAAGILTFGPGVASVFVPGITILGTAGLTGAPNVSFDVTLSSPTNASLGNRTAASVTIQNNQVTAASNGTFSFSCRRYEASEGAGSVAIGVDRATGDSGVATVSYGTSNGSAVAGVDYVAIAPPLQMAPNWLNGEGPAGGRTKTFTVGLIPNAIPEAVRSFNVNLSAPTGGAAIAGDTTAIVSIIDDDVSLVALSATGYAVNANGGSVTITAVRPVGGPAVTVTYGTADGSALAGRDYTAVSGSLNFGAGQTSRTFSVPILNDGASGDRTFQVFIAGGAVGTPSQATVTIRPSAVTTTTTAPATGAIRVADTDRIGTAIEASMVAFPVNGTATVAILARADLFPDALAGTPLSKAKGGPLLLTSSTVLDASVQTELARVLPTGRTVYVLGGTAAIGQAIVDRLVALGYNVVRLGGPNRYDTAVTISRDGLGTPRAYLLASGLDFPDALSAGAAAAQQGAGVLLTAGSTLPAATQAYLATVAGAPLTAIGGPAAAAVPSATPVVGADRYDTAVRTAQRFFTAPARVAVASGVAFPDGLSGGALASLKSGPLLLTDPSTLPTVVRSYLEATSSITTAYVMGGTAAISAAVQNAVAAAIA
ncbi:MAG: cell wall-binding repeat-containing protein [Acidimicrobiales bacterium]|nr:cell wall-binding repeat-containing protein [Acidimicrobiales bacterium]